MKMQRKAKSVSPKGYQSRLRINAGSGEVFRALSTRKGLQGWWTTLVKGEFVKGGKIRFEFEGLDEHIVMQVDETKKSSEVVWTCLEHTSLPEWDGTKIHFDLKETAKNSCELDFAHIGLVPKLTCYQDCKSGWDYFLSSLVDYVESGKGQPYGQGSN